MAMSKPEWAQGFYHKLREYYLTTHMPEDLLDWDDYADETARAIPIETTDFSGGWVSRRYRAGDVHL